MLKSFWTNNQKFLLVTGGVLLVFLIGNSLLSGLVDGAERTYVDCRKLEKRVKLLHKELKQTYWEDLNKLDNLKVREEMLAKELCLPPLRDLSEVKALLVDFNKRVTQIWASVQGAADARGIVLPEKPSGRDFDIDQEDSLAEYRIYHSYLDVLERAMKALVTSGMARIGPPEPLIQFSKAVSLEGRKVGTCYYRGMSFQVTGRYYDYVKLMERLQVPENFLQVRVVTPLEPTRRGEENLLRCEIEFFGLDLEELEEESIFDADDPVELEGRRR